MTTSKRLKLSLHNVTRYFHDVYTVTNGKEEKKKLEALSVCAVDFSFFFFCVRVTDFSVMISIKMESYDISS